MDGVASLATLVASLALRFSVTLVMVSFEAWTVASLALRFSVALVIGSFEAWVIGSSFALWIALSSTCLIFFFYSLGDIIRLYYISQSMSCSLPADSGWKMRKIKPSDKPKSSVYSKNGRKGLGLAPYHLLPWDWESCFAADSVCKVSEIKSSYRCIITPYDSSRSNGAGDSWSKSHLYPSFPADSAFVPKSPVYSKIGRIGLRIAADDWGEFYLAARKIMSKITSSSKNGKIGLGIRTSLSFVFELPFPELALAIGLSKVSICIILFGMVALAEISLQVRVKKHGQGQSSSGPAGGSGAGNAGGSIEEGGGGGDENGTIGHGTGQGRRSGIGGGGRGQGNGDDDDNDGRRIVGNVGNGRRPRNPTPEEIAAIFLPIIIQSIANLMSLNDAELSTTGRANRYFSMIINLVGFICCAAVIWQPYTNPRVATILNPRISGILSRSGSALAFLGFISMMGIDLPLYLSWIMGLAFLVLLAFFVVDISEARQ